MILLEPFGDGVQLVVEQVAVAVQGQRRGGVAEHLLDTLDAGSGADREAGCGVSQLVRHQAGQPDSGRGWVEVGPAEAVDPQRVPPSRGEHEIVRLLVAHVHGELVTDEPRHGHGPPLVRFGFSDDQVAVDLSDGFGDLEPAAREVDASHPKADCLAPAQSAVGEHQDKEAVRTGCVGEVGHLPVVEVAALGRWQPRQVHARDRVAGKPVVLDRVVEHRGEQMVGLSCPRGGQPARAHAGHPGDRVGVGDGLEWDVLPTRQDAGAQQ